MHTRANSYAIEMIYIYKYAYMNATFIRIETILEVCILDSCKNVSNKKIFSLFF